MIKISTMVLAAFFASVLLVLAIPFRIVQFLGFSLIFIILCSYIYAKILSNNIKVTRSIRELKLACKEETYITFSIKNFSRLPAFICYYSDEAPFLYIYNSGNSGITTLRRQEIKKVTYKIAAQYRGLYPVGPVKIRTSDPLGLFDIELEIPCELKIMVRPARIKLNTKAEPGFPQGLLKINNPVYEDITMRRSIREYIRGDEQKRINWRLSAKFGELFTNQYEESFDAPFFIFLNLAEEDYELKNRAYHSEKAIEIAAALVELSRRLKQRCGFASNGSGLPYLKPKQNQSDVILDLLSLIQLEKGKLDYNPEKKFKHQLPTGTMIFVIGPKEVENYFLKLEAGKEASFGL